MSRGRKLTKAEKRRRRQTATIHEPDRELADQGAELLEDLVCSHATAVNAAGLCDARLADLDVDLTFAKLAASLWRATEGKAGMLSGALADLAAENERHRVALEEIAQRLDVLATDESLHDHLAPSVVGPALARAVSPDAPQA